MSSELEPYYATDKDIHDLLYSAKQKLTERVLLELAKDRGLFYSEKESREELVNRLSVLPHDYNDLCSVIDMREGPRRGEKTASVTLATPLSIAELKEVIAEYQVEAKKEDIHSFAKSASEYVMHVEYDEYDYSRTRLIQRQRREAAIEFIQRDGKTLVRLPATEKARAIADTLRSKIESRRKDVIHKEEIELTSLTSPELRTNFFLRLLSSLPGMKLAGVSRLRVASAHRDPEENGAELEAEEKEASEELLSVVHNVVLAGENLVESPEYQQLRERGFFITSIRWRAQQTQVPYDRFEFEAGFEDRQKGRKFRYTVHGAQRFQEGVYTTSLRPLEDKERDKLLESIEETARKVLAALGQTSEEG
jgi:hypothetical protein